MATLHLHPPSRLRAGNRLLDALPRRDRERFLGFGERVELGLAAIALEPGARIRHVHFPVTACVALLTPAEGTSRLEVGLVGDEGMVGTPLALGIATSPLQAIVQCAGSSIRMEATLFRRELAASPALQHVMARYLFVRMTQLAQATACTRFHFLEARLARWFLLTQDRAHSNAFHVTHEFLARMLGVRRSGVTRAATALQASGCIRYSRGDVTVLDRAGLLASACACYGIDRDTYLGALG